MLFCVLALTLSILMSVLRVFAAARKINKQCRAQSLISGERSIVLSVRTASDLPPLMCLYQASRVWADKMGKQQQHLMIPGYYLSEYAAVVLFLCLQPTV